MNWETATKLAYEIGKTKLAEERREFFGKAVAYAQVRVAWQLATPAERVQMDVQRRAIHNSFIEACDALCENMRQEGEDVSWRKELGSNRQEIGDFACYIHLVLGLVAR